MPLINKWINKIKLTHMDFSRHNCYSGWYCSIVFHNFFYFFGNSVYKTLFKINQFLFIKILGRKVINEELTLFATIWQNDGRMKWWSILKHGMTENLLKVEWKNALNYGLTPNGPNCVSRVNLHEWTNNNLDLQNTVCVSCKVNIKP